MTTQGPGYTTHPHAPIADAASRQRPPIPLHSSPTSTRSIQPSLHHLTSTQSIPSPPPPPLPTPHALTSRRSTCTPPNPDDKTNPTARAGRFPRRTIRRLAVTAARAAPVVLCSTIPFPRQDGADKLDRPCSLSPAHPPSLVSFHHPPWLTRVQQTNTSRQVGDLDVMNPPPWSPHGARHA